MPRKIGPYLSIELSNKSLEGEITIWIHYDDENYTLEEAQNILDGSKLLKYFNLSENTFIGTACLLRKNVESLAKLPVITCLEASQKLNYCPQ